MKGHPVYLDYAATTPVDPGVAARMAEHLTLDGIFGNPASRSHIYGWQAEAAVENARREVADLLGADPREIVWTSGATEANNLALKGVAWASAARGRHLVTNSIEHKAVLDPMRWLQSQGYEVSCVAPAATGQIEPEAIAAALRPDTVLVSVMYANNELGTINDIAAIGAICRERGVLLHVDAAQAVGKLAIDLKTLPVDLLSLSAHKLYGPKGIGALYVRRAVQAQLEPLIHGGGHERGMRSGTLPTHQIVGVGEACRLAREHLGEETERLEALRARLWNGIRSLPGIALNGAAPQRLAGLLNIRFSGCDGELLLGALSGLAISSGSACTSASLEPSYVLREIGLSDAEAHSSLRFSLGRFTTEADVDTAVEQVRQAVERLGGLRRPA